MGAAGDRGSAGRCPAGTIAARSRSRAPATGALAQAPRRPGVYDPAIPATTDGMEYRRVAGIADVPTVCARRVCRRFSRQCPAVGQPNRPDTAPCTNIDPGETPRGAQEEQ
nr:hypothetical protein GCM10017611_66010 [Rhodococcus wratislaviensis]